MKRRALLVGLIAITGLPGCAFRPLYGTNGPGEAVSLSGVSVAEQQTRAGQLVRNQLMQSMTGDGPRYLLKIAIVDRQRGKSTLPGTTTTRFELTLNGEYDLVDTRSGKTVATGRSFSTVPFDQVRQPIADLEARNSALDRAAIELANDIKLRVAVYFSKQQ
jgi:LPS-assembly lipoprotein